MVSGVLKASLNELNLSLTLLSGQAFRWRKRNDKQVWFGVIDSFVFDLRQNAELQTIEWTLLNHASNGNKRRKLNEEDINDILIDYFNLNYSLSDLYNEWSKVDENFAKIAPNFLGVRVLRQNPHENLLSFICSSNNNIQRISKMIESLCTKYGTFLMTDDEFGDIHAFPEIKALCNADVEADLRKLGFGYRSKFIAKSAKMVEEKSKTTEWLLSLREKKYDDAHFELMQLSGVGAKVADCVCLMSLDKSEAIPVDTHVWQIATKMYLPHLKKNKSLTDKAYKEVADFFRHRFGDKAGWAHSVLFCSDLRQFKK
ncbi:N-glycosylase/DNA lyase-like protein [Leptotrombidium deliense]|uniref:N-glycosylase/DNA lyase n=1 Tax=Leptotrombidium deliense TaxID=299467 RepID=A0A443SVN1_9ACAR|nr:N-glycosylase/DNA lyase-like protein [Leptotrombidium deliense]